MARASAVTPAAVAYAEALFRRMPKPSFLDVWRATTSLVRPQTQHRFATPLALIVGAQDRAGNIASAMANWAQVEQVALHVIEGAGHLLTLDAPKASAQALLDTIAHGRAQCSLGPRNRASDPPAP